MELLLILYIIVKISASTYNISSSQGISCNKNDKKINEPMDDSNSAQSLKRLNLEDTSSISIKRQKSENDYPFDENLVYSCNEDENSDKNTFDWNFDGFSDMESEDEYITNLKNRKRSVDE